MEWIGFEGWAYLGCDLLGFTCPDAGDVVVGLGHLHLHLHSCSTRVVVVVVVRCQVVITLPWLGPSMGISQGGQRWW
jgi:hypothetical protein